MVSEEAIAFVDLMRADDLDRRAGMASQATNPNERGEPTHEETTESVWQDATTSDGESADVPLFAQQNESETPTPAAPVSEVALGTDTLQASSEEGESASPIQTQESESLEAFTSPGFQEPGEDSRALALFSESSQNATANTPEPTLESEGATITEIQNDSGRTTIIAPPGMPDFNDLLRTFDRDYHPPDPPAGDRIAIPKPPDIPQFEDIRSSTEVAEQMVASMSDDFLNANRRKA